MVTKYLDYDCGVRLFSNIDQNVSYWHVLSSHDIDIRMLVDCIVQRSLAKPRGIGELVLDLSVAISDERCYVMLRRTHRLSPIKINCTGVPFITSGSVSGAIAIINGDIRDFEIAYQEKPSPLSPFFNAE